MTIDTFSHRYYVGYITLFSIPTSFKFCITYIISARPLLNSICILFNHYIFQIQFHDVHLLSITVEKTAFRCIDWPPDTVLWDIPNVYNISSK